jgi:hypothetical protein
VLEAEGWTAPDPEACPTGADLVERYLAPLAATPALRGRIRTGHGWSASPAVTMAVCATALAVTPQPSCCTSRRPPGSSLWRRQR